MPLTHEDQTYLTLQETADTLGVVKQSVYRYVDQKRLRLFKFGLKRNSYFLQTEVLELKKQREEMREP